MPSPITSPRIEMQSTIQKKSEILMPENPLRKQITHQEAHNKKASMDSWAFSNKLSDFSWDNTSRTPNFQRKTFLNSARIMSKDNVVSAFPDEIYQTNSSGSSKSINSRRFSEKLSKIVSQNKKKLHRQLSVKVEKVEELKFAIYRYKTSLKINAEH
jgi:hypothetical protein